MSPTCIICDSPMLTPEREPIHHLWCCEQCGFLVHVDPHGHCGTNVEGVVLCVLCREAVE